MANWDYFLTVEPTAIAYAVDGQGMQALFTGGAIYHGATNRWIPVGDSVKRTLGLMPISSHFDGAGTLEIRPGYAQVFNGLTQGSAGKSAVPTGKPGWRLGEKFPEPGSLGPVAEPEPEVDTGPKDDVAFLAGLISDVLIAHGLIETLTGDIRDRLERIADRA